MQAPAIPDNEAQRLRALRARAILDTPDEERFDRLTRLARHLFGTQIALVSLVDAERQWFKSRQGLDACETARDISFCGHAILADGIFEITDARLDPRFADNPLVSGPPHIRFYAGAPLATADGSRIGTLCIIDGQPRTLTAAQRSALRDLADCVEAEINQIDLQQQSKALEMARQLGEVIARVQSQFIREADRRKAFEGLLTDILALTESEYGFVGEVLYRDEGAPYLKTYAITNIAWDDATRAFYQAHAPQGMAFTNLNTLFGAAMTSGRPVIANDPYHDPRRGGLPEGHPAMNAFLGIPIHHGGELVAMLGMANRPGGYDQALVDFLHPLLVTLGQLIEVARAQKKHREGQIELARLSRVASQTTNAVVITDAGGRVEWVNEGFVRITGYTLDEVLGRKPGEVLQGEATDPATVELMRDALARQAYFEVDVINYTRSRRPFWIRISCNPLRDANGELQGFMAIQSDIDERKQAEWAQQQSEARLRGLFELSPVGIALSDYETGAFIDVNDAMLTPTGYTRDELMGLSYWDLTPHEYEPEELQQLEILEKTGRYTHYEKEYVRKDGTRYPVLLNGMTVYDSSGRKLIWSIVEDITERKRMERMKSEFVSTVSHELRTPLTSISGALGLVAGGALGALPEQAQQMIAIALKNSQRLGFLINDLLDMEKLMAGKLRFDMQIQPLMPLVEHALRDNQAYAARHGVRLHLAHVAGAVQVEVDAQRLQQVLANLLSNAAKFSPTGSEVTVTATCVENTVRVAVSDHGPGIPTEFRDRIFQKFSQADASDTRQKGGSGLGLAISRELVERMGGRIAYESVAGEGATFYFELPLCPSRQVAGDGA
ncbi:PAS domain S-box protein [Rhodoferax sp.]|uniref:PAS domain S-box protein n=1 Tax=Comamonadaceae TaxID=80864 RepID=UPI0035249CA5